MSDVLKNRFKKICLAALAVIIVALILYIFLNFTYSSTENQWFNLSSFSYVMLYSSLPNSISPWLSLGTIFSILAESTLNELNEILVVPFVMIGLGFGLILGSYLQLFRVSNSYNRHKKLDAMGWAFLFVVLILCFSWVVTYSDPWLNLTLFSYVMMYSSLPNSISPWLSLSTISLRLAESTLNELYNLLLVPMLIFGLGGGLWFGSDLILSRVAKYKRNPKSS
ncbi:MAG: hypothetical protein WED07_01770 [Candidatus Freyarchaeum deiterrae]